jgi:hypothetical protein
VQGNAHLRGLPPIVIDRSFRDTLSDLDMAGMVVVEARRGQWGLLSDITYIDTTQHVEVSPLGLDGRFGNRATTASLMVTYRAIDEGGFSLDVLAGARHWDAAFDLALDAPLALRRRTDIAWIDPALGLRAGWRPAPRHGLTLWAIGSAADGVPLDLLATYGFGLTPDLWLRIGYRHLEIGHRTGSADVDLTLAGPGAGLEFRF